MWAALNQKALKLNPPPKETVSQGSLSRRRIRGKILPSSGPQLPTINNCELLDSQLRSKGP